MGPTPVQNTKIKFTYTDYLQLPEQDRRELIGGDFYVVPSPSVRHQQIVVNIGRRLSEHVRSDQLGRVLWAPLDVVLSDEDVVQPDIMYISKQRRGIISEQNISGAPDLVIEILSPSTADRDRGLKQSLYARFRIGEYWIVDPEERSVQVMELGTEAYDAMKKYGSGTVSSPSLPALNLTIDEVFAEQ